MREAAEAGDDVAMLGGRFQVLLAADRVHQRASEVLVGQHFAVAKRHVEEQPVVGRERGWIEARERKPRRFQRLRIAAEGARRLAKAVARELVAQKDQRQRGLGRIPPGIEPARHRLLDARAEARHRFGVELGGAAPPDLARLGMLGMAERQVPEIEDVADAGGDGRGVAHGA